MNNGRQHGGSVSTRTNKSASKTQGTDIQAAHDVSNCLATKKVEYASSLTTMHAALPGQVLCPAASSRCYQLKHGERRTQAAQPHRQAACRRTACAGRTLQGEVAWMSVKPAGLHVNQQHAWEAILTDCQASTGAVLSHLLHACCFDSNMLHVLQAVLL